MLNKTLELIAPATISKRDKIFVIFLLSLCFSVFRIHHSLCKKLNLEVFDVHPKTLISVFMLSIRTSKVVIHCIRMRERGKDSNLQSFFMRLSLTHMCCLNNNENYFSFRKKSQSTERENQMICWWWWRRCFHWITKIELNLFSFLLETTANDALELNLLVWLLISSHLKWLQHAQR